MRCRRCEQNTFDELNRLFADADQHDETIRQGWLSDRDTQLIDKYGSLEDAKWQIDRDNHDPEDLEDE